MAQMSRPATAALDRGRRFGFTHSRESQPSAEAGMTAPPLALAPDSRIARLYRLIHTPPAQRVLVTAILVNGMVLGLETSPSVMAVLGVPLFWLDHAILALFVLELTIKIAGEGPRFFRDGWNLFDLLVVTVALVPSEGFLAVLRTLRILRVMRMLSVVQELRYVTAALLHSLPSMASIAGLLALLLYVFAVLATDLFGARAPELFGTLGTSMYALFQVMTLDGWSEGIARPVMAGQPWAWAFFVAFIVLVTMAVLNLFVGVIVNSMQAQHAARHGHQITTDPVVAAELRALRQEIAALRAAIDRPPQG
jgi:voltage-gated sodium channel